MTDNSEALLRADEAVFDNGTFRWRSSGKCGFWVERVDGGAVDVSAAHFALFHHAAALTRPSSPAASDGDLEDEVAVFLRAYGDAFVREVLKQAAPVSDGGAVRHPDTPDDVHDFGDAIDPNAPHNRRSSPVSSTDVLCKGSWELGTACGKCPRCLTSQPTGSEREKVIEEIAAYVGARFIMSRWDDDPAVPTLVEVVNAIRALASQQPTASDAALKGY